MRKITAFLFSSAAFLLLQNPALAAGNSVTYGNANSYNCYMGANLAHLSAESAMPACNKALSFQRLSRTERAATLVNRGILRTHLREYDAALDDFDRALELVSNFAESHLNRGNAFLFLGRYDLAVADYDAAIEAGTRRLHAAFYNRGLAREAMKRPKLAYEDFRRAAELKPSWDLALSRVARYAGMGYGQ